MWSGSWRRWGKSTRETPTTSCTRTATTSPLHCPRSCVVERSLAGSTAWPTSAPVCHFSRAACPRSGWPLPRYSPAWARSCMGRGIWRRPRTPLPLPLWPLCRPARPLHPPAHRLCLATHAISRGGRRAGQRRTVGCTSDVNAVYKQSTCSENVNWKEQSVNVCCWQMLDFIAPQWQYFLPI